MVKPISKPRMAEPRTNTVLSFPRGLLRQFAVSLRQNRGLAVLAILLSVGLWVYVNSELNPPRVDVYPSPIPVQVRNIPPGMELYNRIEPVKIRISAPQEMWNRLRSDSFSAYVDLSKAGTGAQRYPIVIQRPDTLVNVEEVIPDKATVRLEIVKQKSVPVRVNLVGAVPFGWIYKQPKPGLSEVTVRGPEAAVNEVDRATADISLEGATLGINQLFNLVPTNVRGAKVEDISMDPSAVDVEVPIEQQIHSNTVPVNPSVTGNVAPGYWLSGITVEPSTVVLVGDKEVLQTVTFVRTLPVDVSGATSEVSQSVGLDLPQGVSPASTQNVTIRAVVAVVNGTKTFAVAPSVKGAPAGWQASANPVNVTLSGPISVLRDTFATDIKVVLDVTDLPAGTHIIAPQVSVPARTELVAVSPEKESVTLQVPVQPSPTVTPTATLEPVTPPR